MFNSVGICNFTAGPVWSLPLNKWPEVVYAATGWESSLFELCKLGERTVTMARVFNLRGGFGRKDDTLPDRIFEALEGGALAGKGIDRKEFDEILTLYYGAMGWDPKEGAPTRGETRLGDVDVFDAFCSTDSKFYPAVGEKEGENRQGD